MSSTERAPGAPPIIVRSQSYDKGSRISSETPPIRQHTAPTTEEPKPRSRNPRNLTLPALVSPPVSPSTAQPHRYQSLAEGASNLAGLPSSGRPTTPSIFGRLNAPIHRPSTPIIGKPPLSPLPSMVSPNVPKSASLPKKGKLKSLLPRSHHQSHSYFLAKIEIEQLANVPFVRGEFNIRWKLRGAVGREEAEAGGLLGKIKGKSSNKGKGKDDLHEFGSAPEGSMVIGSYSSTESYITHSMTASGSSSASVSASGAATKVGASGRNLFSPPETSPTGGHGVNQYLFSTVQEESVIFSPNTQSFAAAGMPLSPGFAESALSPGLMNIISPTGTITQTNAGSHPHGFGGVTSPQIASFPSEDIQLTPPRGATPFLPLKDHSIAYAYPLSSILKFDIARGNSNHQGKPKPNLSSSEFKLVVSQRVIPDDPDGPPQNPRLGAVYLNLAEYVGKGRVERRYLLKESRVNATLKVSIELTYVSGNADYIAPPLAKAEIMGGIEGFLTQNDSLYKQRAKDIYGYAYQNKDDDLGDSLEDEATMDEERMSLQDDDGRDPYALPSESESELESSAVSEIDRARRDFLRNLNSTGSIPRAPKAQQTLLAQQATKDAELQKRRAVRREERRKRFHLELESNPYALPPTSDTSGSEAENDTESDADFESAEEESIDHTEDSHSNMGHNREQTQRPLPQRRRQQQEVELAAFDVQRLPLAYGPKTTEALIDALFNPVLTTDKRRDNPFTVYVDPDTMDTMPEDEREMLYVQFGGRLAQPPANGGTSGLSPVTQAPRRNYSTSTSATGSSAETGSSKESAFARLRSPGEETVVGFPPLNAGLGIQGLGDQNATIGRKAERFGVGSKLQQYYRTKKDQIKDKRRPRRSDTAGSTASTTSMSEEHQHAHHEAEMNVLGSPVYSMEPGEMDSRDFSAARARVHRRRETATTIESTLSSVPTHKSSTSSLSSLSLSSQSGDHVAPHHHHSGVPPLAPGNVASAAAMVASSANTGSNEPLQRGSPPGGGSSAPQSLFTLTRQTTAASNDLSVPSGRMDKTGFVKGSPTLNASSNSGLGSSFNRWWRGLGSQPPQSQTVAPPPPPPPSVHVGGPQLSQMSGSQGQAVSAQVAG